MSAISSSSTTTTSTSSSSSSSSSNPGLSDSFLLLNIATCSMLTQLSPFTTDPSDAFHFIHQKTGGSPKSEWASIVVGASPINDFVL